MLININKSIKYVEKTEFGFIRLIRFTGLTGLFGYPVNHPLTRYPMIHPVNPVIQTDESESGQTSDG